MSLPLLNLYNTSVLTEFLIIKTRVFQDTVCKQHVYQNMAPKKKLKFMWCFHFTKTKIIDQPRTQDLLIIDVRDFATDRLISY